MLNLGLFEIRTDVFVLIVSALFFCGQLLLCFKVKNRFLRIIPIWILFVITVSLGITALFLDGWDALGFIFLGIFNTFLLFGCILAWIIWNFIKRFKIKRESK